MPDGTQVQEDELEMAAEIVRDSKHILMLAKDSVKKAFETHLAEGIHLERRLLYATFATEDQRKGMTPFAEKRAPQFRNR